MGNHPQDGPPEDAAWHPPGALPSPAGGPDTGRIPRPGGNTGPTDQPYGPPSVPANQGPSSVPANQWGQPPQWPGYGPPQNGQNWQNRMYLAPPKPGVIPLRPLGLGEMLDGAFQACRRNPLATFGSAILFQAIVTVVTVLMTSGLFAALDQLDPETASTEDLGGFFATLASFTSVITVVSAAGLLILQGVLVIPVARAVLNQRTGFSLMWKLAGRRILPLVLLGLLLAVGTAVVLGVFVLISVGLAVALDAASLWIILPLFLGVVALGIWLGIKLVVAPAALMLEGTGPFASIRRSWMLTRRNWWRTFGIVVLTSIIVTIIASVISAPLAFLLPLFFSFSDSPLAMGADFSSSLPLLLVTQGITAFFTAIGYAFQAGVTALLYIDLRIRREGFDVVLMKEHEQPGGIPSDALPGTSVHFGHEHFGHGSGGPRTGSP